MELKQLKAFIAVAERLNFTRAAEDLYISQPSLSQRIASLEDELSCKLFYRKNPLVSLTLEGQLFLDEILPYVRGIDSAKEHILQINRQSKEDKNLVVAFPMMTLQDDQLLTNRLFSEYVDQHSSSYAIYKTKIEQEEAARKIAAGIIDMFFFTKRPWESVDSDFIFLPLKADENVILVTKGTPKNTDVIAYINEHCFVHGLPYKEDDTILDVRKRELDLLFSEIGVYPRELCIEGFTDAIDMVAQGRAVMLCPNGFYQGYLQKTVGALRLPSNIKNNQLIFGALCSKNNYKPAFQAMKKLMMTNWEKQ